MTNCQAKLVKETETTERKSQLLYSLCKKNLSNTRFSPRADGFQRFIFNLTLTYAVLGYNMQSLPTWVISYVCKFTLARSYFAQKLITALFFIPKNRSTIAACNRDLLPFSPRCWCCCCQNEEVWATRSCCVKFISNRQISSAVLPACTYTRERERGLVFSPLTGANLLLHTYVLARTTSKLSCVSGCWTFSNKCRRRRRRGNLSSFFFSSFLPVIAREKRARFFPVIRCSSLTCSVWSWLVV